MAFACVYAQIEKANDLQNKFQQYQLHAFTEKLFLHIDKTVYLPGEIAWFKIYDVDGYFNNPFAATALAYVEMMRKDGVPVLQMKIGIKDGQGNGSLIIPATIPTGNYILRAYTSWMKNFDPEYYFEQKITVINTLKDTTDAPAKLPKGFDIQFFPEGGNLVSGLLSKVGFKIINQNGESEACKGAIVNQKNDTIVSFKTARFGMGNFNFSPNLNDQYFAHIIINDSIIIKKLPVVYDHGYVMALSDFNNDKIKITVHSNILLANPVIYLFTQAHQLIKNVQVGYINNGEVVFFIDKKIVADGISHITVFNAEKIPVCERLYFKQPLNQMHIEIQNQQPKYTTRKKIDLSLLTTDQSEKPLEANLSMSVFLIDSLQPIPQKNILNYLLLTSDLKGNIEEPQYYFTDAQDVAETSDNLMLTQGWSRFKWEDILKDKNRSFEFLPEIEGPVIYGKVVDKKTGNPGSSITAYLTVPDTAFELKSSVSKSNGDVWFNTKNYYGNREIVVQTNYQTDSNYRVDIQNPFSEKFSSLVLPQFYLDKKQQPQILNRSINTQVENTYRLNQKNKILLNKPGDTTSFYGKPDLEYNLDDYTRFITLEEVMREYIADVRVRKENGKFYYRVKNGLFNTFFEDAPLLLIDGVPVFDADKIIAFDPLKIKKIEVVSKKYFLGNLVTDGIVSYKTYKGDLAGYQLDANAVALQYNGLQQQREFYTPVYENSKQIESRLPDFRNLLTWMPDIKTGINGVNNLSFYTSDVTGKFAVFIQGLTNNGLAGSKIFTFNVSK
jgi:hypothetical protein